MSTDHQAYQAASCDSWSSATGCAGPAFYRAESAQARDLAVLAAAVLKQEGNGLRVFEVLAGCGIRSKRYLQQVQGTANNFARHPSAVVPSSNAALVSRMCKTL